MMAFTTLAWFIPLASQSQVPCHLDQRTVPCCSPLSATTAGATALQDDLLVAIREGVADAAEGDLGAWEESVSLVAKWLDNDANEAERLLADATRWTAWARAGKLARKYIKPETADPQKVQASMDWLQTGPLGLSQQQIVDAVRNYPRLYLLDPAEAYRKVTGVAPREFRDASVLKDLIVEDPSVLQFQYNCDNDCISECGSCWVTFKNRMQ